MRWLSMVVALFATMAAVAQDEACEVACGNPLETHWRGSVVAPEDRCSGYSAGHYSYPASIEAHIVQAFGGIFSPYTGEWFDRTQRTDIEHIVARSEAHDSGMCVSGASAPPGFFSLTRGRNSRAAARGFAIAGARRRSSPACS